MLLGIDKQGFVYDTFGTTHFVAVSPSPMLSQATFINDPVDWNHLPAPSRFEGMDPLIFREDHFDPVSRTRRGRLYETRQGTQPDNEYVAAGSRRGNEADPRVPMYVYQSPWRLVSERRDLEGRTLALGTNLFATAWRIVGVEMVGVGNLLLTLRGLSTFGVIPELATDRVPDSALDRVQRELRHLSEAAFRESPNGVIDRCRNALMVVIASWLEARDGGARPHELELAPLAEKLRAVEKNLAANATVTVAVLHGRTKPNVQRQKAVAPPTDEDAMLALHEVGAVLRELGWARTI